MNGGARASGKCSWRRACKEFSNALKASAQDVVGPRRRSERSGDDHGLKSKSNIKERSSGSLVVSGMARPASCGTYQASRDRMNWTALSQSGCACAKGVKAKIG